MKNFSVLLNILLLAAVGFLYYHNFSGPGKKGKTTIPENTAKKDSADFRFKVAYVDMDSLSERITYFKQSRKDIEQQQKSIENDYANAYKALEAKKNSFLQQNQNPSPEEIQNIQAKLMQEQQNIETKKQNTTQQLSQKNFELVEKIRKNLKEFLVDYNQQKKYHYILTTSSDFDYLIFKDSTLNITNDVIKGMNEKMTAKGQ